MTRRTAVRVIGVGADGCASLSARALGAISSSQVLVGGERQLAFFPEFGGERVVLQNGIGAALDLVERRAGEENVAILASGDPLFFGIGATVVKRLGTEHVEVIPQPSAVQWAFARVGLPWHDARLLSLHGRAREGFVTRLRRVSKVACFTDPEQSPPVLARHMIEHGETRWRAWVCENLAAADERVRSFPLEELASIDDVGALNVLVLARDEPGWWPPPLVPFVAEEAYAKRMPKLGLITKREIRTLAIAALELRADSVVWDVGAGSGSVAVEAAALAEQGVVCAVEIDPEGAAICRENARAHHVDNVRVIEGRAPEALADLPDPDAVFVGGSKGSLDDIVGVALDRLRPGGRLVVNAITLENVGEAYRVLRGRGLDPDVLMLNIARAVPLARYLRWESLNPVHLFAVTKPAPAAEVIPS